MIDKIVRYDECTGCSACYAICPQECISMREDEGGFLYPNCDGKKCIRCNACVAVCPSVNFERPEIENTKAYGIQIKDTNILRDSSSGGVFSLLAHTILQDGGVIFGAAFSDDFKSVFHMCVTNEGELHRLRGAKYVQSEIGEAYREVKKYLEIGKKVLFSGTACQIAGLRKFLKKDYINIIMIDILCHGVPSPKMWSKYLDFRSRQNNNEKPIYISFREKTHGWHEYSLVIKYPNAIYSDIGTKDKFLQGFLRDVFLRRSCYKCKYKDIERCSDLTLGDFWDIGRFKPDMDDNCGISLVLVHTNRGMQILQNLLDSDKCIYEEIESPEMVVNGGLHKNAFYNVDRGRLMKNIDNMNFEQLEKAYFSKRLICKIKRNLSRIIGKYIISAKQQKTVKDMLG